MVGCSESRKRFGGLESSIAKVRLSVIAKADFYYKLRAVFFETTLFLVETRGLEPRTSCV